MAPLINGVSVLDANAATMDETLTWFCKDGVLYELIECDDLEIFADRGVQLGIVDSFGSETAAFRMDNESGSYRKVEDYAGTIALFLLPLDTTKADPAAAEEYLKKLEEAAAEAEAADTEGTAGRAEVSVITGAESKAAAGYMNQQVRDFVDGITADNLSDYFEIVKDYPVFSATPDENGWVDFGTQYIEKKIMLQMAEAAKFPTGLQRMNILASMQLPCQETMEKKMLPHFGFPLFSAMKTEVLQKHCIRSNRTASI